MGRITKFAVGPRSKWLVIGAWVLVAIALAPLQPRLQDEAADESDAFQAASAESTRASDLIDQRFGEGSEVNTVVAYTRDGGLTSEDNARITAEMTSLCDSRTIPTLVRVITPFGLACGDLSESIAPSSPAVGPVSRDGTTALVTIQSRDDATDAVVRDVATIRQLVPDPDADGLRAYVTGETAFAADQSASFEGIDETLLLITAVLILVLLLAVYRSPIAAMIPLGIVSLAYLIAAGAIYGLAKAGVLDVTGQATAILIVLMFGAGTDYCLLIVSRYKEELRRGAAPQVALLVAAERSGAAILSAGGIVVVAMLVLTLADYSATATMGPVLALGTAVTVLAGLTLLPALLAALGGRAFWPRVPAAAREPGGGRDVWSRAGALVRARPWTTIGVVSVVLVSGALGALESRGVLAFSDNFRNPPESVQAQDLITSKYEPGVIGPADALVASSASGTLVEDLANTPGVVAASNVSISKDRQLTLIEVILDADPFSQEAIDAVPRLRQVLREGAGGGLALLGGPTAESHDTREALRSDALLVVPLTLLLILLIVAALVRAVIAPLYLVASVVLSYAFALGASSLFFTHVLGEPDSDPALPTFAFVFLVALGVDYNIFLISRIREERARLGSRDAVIAGLERSGGVITSAGLILAGTFCTLIALDVVGLAQVGFTVAFGLLVDTFVVRCFLVPAIGVVLGDRSWWPARPVPAAAKVAACAVIALVALAARDVPRARADTFTVRSTADSGPGSLREAITAAEAAAGGDVIVVEVTGELELHSQLSDVHTDVTIRGPGRGLLRIARAPDAEHGFRLLTVGPTGVVEVSGLALAGGRVQERSSPRGGGVANAGHLRLIDVLIAGNEVEGRLGIAGGGGVSNTGTLELVRSVIRDNRAVSTEASAGGGGVHNLGTLLVEDSTVTGNMRSEAIESAAAAGIEQAAGQAAVRRSTIAANGGTGIHNGFADLVVENSTVSGNAGGISAIGGQTAVTSSTITGAGGGGGPNLAGLQVDVPSRLTVENTILAGAGSGSPNCVTTAQVEAVSMGHNLADDTSCSYLTAVGDRQGLDPALHALADNGGPTETHAFPAGSPAHDQGRSGPLAVDQRGLTRPIDAWAVADAAGGDGADVGALELAVPATPRPAPQDGPPPTRAAETPPQSPDTQPERRSCAARRARLRVERVIRRGDGSARVRICVPARGRVLLTGRGVRPVARRVTRTRAVTLPLEAEGTLARRLERRGSVRARARLAFRARVGGVQLRSIAVRLARRP